MHLAQLSFTLSTCSWDSGLVKDEKASPVQGLFLLLAQHLTV